MNFLLFEFLFLGEDLGIVFGKLVECFLKYWTQDTRYLELIVGNEMVFSWPKLEFQLKSLGVSLITLGLVRKLE